ncbi:synaptobrevin-domain-containing protein [Zopfochytrium polystomum]|nr:synaptobrevin-domain-containing protein [Zopfochytrium polystomum]
MSASGRLSSTSKPNSQASAPRPGRAGANEQQSKKNGPETVKQVEDQVEEVVIVMQDNIRKVLIRGDDLAAMQKKTESLNASSAMFQQTAVKVERLAWWRDVKTTIVLVLTVVAVIGALVVAAYLLRLR